MKRLKTFVRNIKTRITKRIAARKTETEKEYSKRMLDRVLDNCLPMMWCSYILAAFDKISIAESLSETIATVIVGAIVSYFTSKTFENVNKYGSRLNKTTAEQESSISSEKPKEDYIELNIDC